MSNGTQSTEFKVVQATPDGAPITQYHIYRKDGDKWTYIDYHLTKHAAIELATKHALAYPSCSVRWA